jgi:hypothetical protein
MLAQPLYAGKLRTGAEAEHEAIIDADLWDRVQAIRSGASRKGGRQADGGHLLVRGTLRLYLRGGDDPPEGPPRS